MPEEPTKPRMEPKLFGLNRYLDAPPPERDAWVRVASRVPEECPGGLRKLLVTSEQAAGLDEIGWQFRCYAWNKPLSEKRQGVWLVGPEGAGKSALLSALAYDLRHRTGPVPYAPPAVAYPHSAKHVEAIYWRAADLFRRMKKAHQNEQYAAEVEEARECAVLVLDDLHLLPLPAWGHLEFSGLIEYRFANGWPICWGGREDPPALLQKVAVAENGEGRDFALSALTHCSVRSTVIEVPLGAHGDWHKQPRQTRPTPEPFFTEWPDKREVQR